MSLRSRPVLKVYGRIPHLPGSRLGPDDSVAHVKNLRLRPGDRVWIQEKLDGSNVAIARIGDELLPLVRAGFAAADARRPMHRLFAAWALAQGDFFRELLRPGERLVGEWLLLAHGTRYALPHAPFVPFDLMLGAGRLPLAELQQRLAGNLPLPYLYATQWLEPEQVCLAAGGHGAIDPPEGLIYRIERASGHIDVCKWVHPAYQPGRYFQDDEAVLPNVLRPEDQALLDELSSSAFDGLQPLR